MMIGERFRFSRKRKKITQEEVSKGICSVSYYSKIENGDTIPSNEVITLLSNRLCIQIQDPHSIEITVKLREKGLRFYRLIRNNELFQAKKLYQEIIDEFSDVIDPDISLITGLVQLRMALFYADFAEAANHYSKVLKLSEYQDGDLSFMYYRVCGLYEYLCGDLREALRYYENIIQIGNYEFVEEVYYQMALIYSRLNKLSFSTFYLEKALEIFAMKMDYEQCTNCNLILGVNYRKMGEFEKSIDCFNNILVQTQNSNNELLAAKVYHNLGLVHSNLEQKGIAIKYLLESIHIKCRFIDSGVNPANTIYLLAKEFFELDKKEDVQKWIQKGLQIIQGFDCKDDKIKLNFLKHLVEDNDNMDESFMTTVAIPFFERRGEAETVSEFNYLLSCYYERNNDYKKAYLLLKKSYRKRGVM